MGRIIRPDDKKSQQPDTTKTWNTMRMTDHNRQPYGTAPTQSAQQRV